MNTITKEHVGQRLLLSRSRVVPSPYEATLLEFVTVDGADFVKLRAESDTWQPAATIPVLAVLPQPGKPIATTDAFSALGWIL